MSPNYTSPDIALRQGGTLDVSAFNLLNPSVLLTIETGAAGMNLHMGPGEARVLAEALTAAADAAELRAAA